MPLGDWIEPKPEGIYIPAADSWVDPSRPVPRALVTHGHADHARGGHGEVHATAETLAIMGVRYGAQSGIPVAYGETLRIGEVDATFLHAGHVLGSAQILLEHRGERVIVSGDYKRRPDPTCVPFEVVSCDVFITEATFGLPVFRHPETHDEMDKLLARGVQPRVEAAQAGRKLPPQQQAEVDQYNRLLAQYLGARCHQ